ncbi:MAG: hypothetical protein KDC38_02915 [Planctomycetes bacterium]|nr:hypothetical protein [Planctomycetota bacterium]
MTHDVYFRPGKPRDRDSLTRAVFDHYVDTHPFLDWSPSPESGPPSRVCYSNPSTEVEFHYEWLEVDDASDDPRLPVSCDVDGCRPHVFGLEAAHELGRFAERFDLRVDDPQEPEAPPFRWSRDRFIESYEKTRRACYRALVHPDRAPPAPAPPTLPRATLRATWRWNFERAADPLGGREISFVRVLGIVRTVVPFGEAGPGDASPTWLPEVDLLLVTEARSGVPRLLPRTEFDAHLGAPEIAAGALGRWRLDPDLRTLLLRQIMEGPTDLSLPFTVIGLESILDREDVESARRGEDDGRIGFDPDGGENPTRLG